jgi:TfoX/Sxy family transcriptional regulator of competence genes
MMPTFTKSPPELVERFTDITSGMAGTEPRQMFGYPCLFVGGNLVTGLHEATWFVRLPEPARSELMRNPGASPFAPMPGRPMAAYVVLPSSIVVDDEALRGWLAQAIEFGRSLPVKHRVK